MWTSLTWQGANQWLPGEQGRAEWEIMKGHEETFRGNSYYMLIILFVVTVLQIYTYVKAHQIGRFKYVQFTTYQFCLNKKNNKKQC